MDIIRPQQKQPGMEEDSFFYLRHFELPVSDSNPHKHTLRKFRMNIEAEAGRMGKDVDATHMFYKQADGYILVYKTTMTSVDAVSQSNINEITDWIQQREIKRQEWFVVILFEV